MEDILGIVRENAGKSHEKIFLNMNYSVLYKM